MVDKPDYGLEIKMFLKEVKKHQDRINVVVSDSDDDLTSDTHVPNNVKPFLTKEINFELFL